MIMQRRKKIIIIIMILVVLVLSYGVYSVFQNNYRFGSDLYNAVNRAWIQSYNIVVLASGEKNHSGSIENNQF